MGKKFLNYNIHLDNGREPSNPKEYKIAVDVFLKIADRNKQILGEMAKEVLTERAINGDEYAYSFIKANVGQVVINFPNNGGTDLTH